MNVTTAFKLGRVSNLPTVWTNILAGFVLAGSIPSLPLAATVLIALSLFYVGGMFLNDAYDAEIDAIERPERPIPSGMVSKNKVFTFGFGMMGAAIVLLAIVGMGSANGTGLWPAFGGIVLAGLIVLYNWHHKDNPLSPVIMGLCRVLVYVTAGLCIAVPPAALLWLGAGLLLCYLIGLTYVAKQENIGEVKNMWPLLFLAAPVVWVATQLGNNSYLIIFWLIFTVWVIFALFHVKRRGPGDIPKAVVSLIAGMCLLDACLIASQGELFLAMVAVFGFGLTLVFQKFVAGT